MVNVSFQRFLFEEADAETHEAEDNQQVQDVCSISINEIFAALSKKATDEAKKAAGNYKIINTACEGDGDKTKFLGAGTHLIVALNTSSDNMNSKTTSGKIDKGEALHAIKSYVSWFSGPDVAAKITENDLQPYRTAMSKGEVDTKNAKDMNAMNKEKAAEAPKESMSIDQRLLNLLFEADEKEEKDVAAEANDNVVGYAIMYSIELGGYKGSSAEDAWKRLIKSLKSDPLTVKFSNNLFGGNEWEVGTSVDDIQNIGKVDATKVVEAIRKQFTGKYSGIKNPQIEVLDNKSLSRYLSKSAKLTTADKERMNKIPYSVCIKINKGEQGYELLKKQDIADIIIAATHDSQFLGLGSIDLTQRDVIFVNNYSDEYKNKAENKFKKDTEKNKSKNDNGVNAQ